MAALVLIGAAGKQVMGALPLSHADQYDRGARAGGFSGPILQVGARIRTFPELDSAFDSEVRYETPLDRSWFVDERRFASGSDEVTFYRLPDQVPCLHPAGSSARR